jgi:hypothetical protein
MTQRGALMYVDFDFEKCAPGERAGAASAETAYLILAAKDERR